MIKRFLINIGLLTTLLLYTSCADIQEIDIQPTEILDNNSAVALMGQFNFEEAYILFQRLVLNSPQNTELQTNMAIALLNRQRKGDEVEALNILQNVLRQKPGDKRARYCAALLYLHLGDLENALNSFLSVLESNHYDPDILYFTGKTLTQLSRYSEALDYFEKAIRKDQYLSSAYYASIMALRQLNKPNEALEFINMYRDIKDNPRARIAEFKYSKMGQLAEVVTLDRPEEMLRLPDGLLFLDKKDVSLTNASTDLFPSTRDYQDFTIADINGDTFADIFIPGSASKNLKNLVLLGQKDVTLFSVDYNHPLAQIEDVNTALWGDINDDGLIDVYLCRKSENQLWQQNDKREWRNVTAKSHTSGEALDTIGGALFDADHDGDLDIFAINKNGANELFNNNRDGSFRTLAKKKKLTGQTESSKILIQDLDNDRDVDIIVINNRAPHDVFINERLWQYSKGLGFDRFVHHDIVCLTAGDMNSDGHIELYTLSSQGQLHQWTKGQSDIWHAKLLLEKPAMNLSAKNAMLSLADFDGDGNLEIFSLMQNNYYVFSFNGKRIQETYSGTNPENHLTTNILTTVNGPALLIKNSQQPLQILLPGKARFDFALVELAGRKEREANLRTNTSGIGSTLSVRVGSRWTVLDTFNNNGLMGQNAQPSSVGLGGANLIDFIQVDWPDGVFQTEMGLSSNSLHKIVETQRQMSSCPVLFAWDGEKFDFVSDLLGVGGIGYAVGPGVYAEPRPWENFLLPQKFSKPLNNKIQVKMTEPMEEVEYLDSVSMTAYDLPPLWSMTLDERMGIFDPQPTGEPIFYKNSLFPVAAVNQHGKDVTQTVIENDLIAAPVGKLDRRFIGMLSDFHTITLTFASPLDLFPGTPTLVADGWVEYPYSQTSFAAWQAGAEYIAPSIEVKPPDGRWQLLLEQFGYPAGMPRQMSVPLHYLPAGVRTIRITTNQEIYWDRLFIAFGEPCPLVKKYSLDLSSAILDNIGFPKREDYQQRRPYYDFAVRNISWDSRILEGNYTKFGDVMELVKKRDSALAIIGPGEGVHLQFDVPAITLQEGWSRNYVLNSFGWCKDMDLFTNTGDTVAPLPGIPENNYVKILHKKYNTRYLTGRL